MCRLVLEVLDTVQSLKIFFIKLRIDVLTIRVLLPDEIYSFNLLTVNNPDKRVPITRM